MSAPSCPTPDQLADFALGLLSEAVARAVAAHLDDCESCRTLVEAQQEDGVPQRTSARDPAAKTWSSSALPPYVTDSPSWLKRTVGDSIQTDATVAAQDALPDSSERVESCQCPTCHAAVTASLLAAEETLLCRACGSSFRVAAGEGGERTARRLQVIGKFKLLDVAGRGAFGTVYRAQDTELNREVAVKVPRSGAFSSELEEARFLGEARKVAHLSHRGIVPVYEVGRTEAFPYIVTEFVKGITLAEAMKSRRFMAREVAELVAAVADSLEHAHENGVVHRDLKPSNIMLAPRVSAFDTSDVASSTSSSGSSFASRTSLEFHPRLMDFGLARREGDQVTVTVAGQILGTPAYMSPEQARGESHAADRRADVYSLGVVMYELLAGERPFRGKTRELLRQVLNDDAPSLRGLNSTIPTDLDTICLKCLEKKPEQRYQTAGDLHLELRRFLRGEPIFARRISKLNRAWRWCARRRVLTTTVVTSTGIVIAVIVVAFALITRSRAVAIRNKEQAVEYFRLSQQTVDTSFTGFAEALRFYPGVQGVRERVLAEAAKNYETFTQQVSGDLDLEIERGRAYLRLGDIYRLRHKLEQAQQAYRQAEVHFEKLIDSRPDCQACRWELANSHARVAQLLALRGLFEDSVLRLEAAIVEIEQLTGQRPPPTLAGVASLRPYATLAATLVNYGSLLMEMGRSSEALAVATRAVSLFDELHACEPDETKYREGRAIARSVVGGIHLQLGNFDDAADVFQSAAVNFDQLVAQFPDNPSYLDSRAETTIFRSYALHTEGRYRDELAAYRTALADYNRLVQVVPLPEFEHHQALTRLNIGQLLHQFGENEEARLELHSALDTATALQVAAPNVVDYRSLQAGCNDALGLVLTDVGDTDEAALHLRRSVQQFESLLADLPLEDQIPQYPLRLAVARRHLAELCPRRQERHGGVAVFSQAAELLASLVVSHSDPRFQNEAALVDAHAALAAADQDDVAKATATGQAAVRRWQQLCQSHPQPEYLVNLARFLSESPPAGLVDPQMAIECATQALEQSPTSAECQTTFGAALCRGDRWSEAVQALHKAAKFRGETDDIMGFFLAMAESRLDHPQLAAEHFAAASRWMDEHRPASRRLQRIRDECEAVISNSLHRE